MPHYTHRMNAYHDGTVWVAYCQVCSAEGDKLNDPCPGEYRSKSVELSPEDQIKGSISETAEISQELWDKLKQG